MNIEQALMIIDQALASLSLKRADHAALIKALEVVKDATKKEG